MLLFAMKPIEAFYEHGHLRPVGSLPLREHQHVWLAILTEEPSSDELARLASEDPSFSFLKDSREDLYSSQDGQPV